MKFPLLLKIVFSTCFLSFLVSCVKEADAPSANVKFKVPIKLVTTNSQNNLGQIQIDYGINNYMTEFEDLALNEVTEIELEHTSEAYYFKGNDQTDGQIGYYIDHEELKTFTKDDPLILKFGHYKDQIIASYTVGTTTDSKSDVLVNIADNGLFQIDWGDGNIEVIQSESNDFIHGDHYLHHSYESNGDYTVTLTTTNLSDVLTLELNVQVYSNPDIIKTIDVGAIPNLTRFVIGDNTIIEMDDILRGLPELKFLTLGTGIMTSVDLSNNTKLEILHLTGEPYSEINGLELLTKMQFLVLDVAMDEVDTSFYPDLERLNLYGSSLKNLDISTNTKLHALWLKRAELQNLDLSKNDALTTVIFDDISLPIYDLSDLNKLKYLFIRALVTGEIQYPENMDNLTYIDYSAFSRIDDVIGFTERMLESQERSPKEKVTIKYPRNRYPSLPQQDELEALVENWDWIVEYKNN